MDNLMKFAAISALACGLALASVAADAQVYYTINGQPVTYEVQRYMALNGLPPGHYWLDRDGYWGVVGESRPLGNIHSGTYFSGSGSGEQASNGWSHYNNHAGTWVGGDNKGCIYTPNWSNC